MTVVFSFLYFSISFSLSLSFSFFLHVYVCIHTTYTQTFLRTWLFHCTRIYIRDNYMLIARQWEICKSLHICRFYACVSTSTIRLHCSRYNWYIIEVSYRYRINIKFISFYQFIYSFRNKYVFHRANLYVYIEILAVCGKTIEFVHTGRVNFRWKINILKLVFITKYYFVTKLKTFSGLVDVCIV